MKKNIKGIKLTKIEDNVPAVKKEEGIDQAWPWPQEINEILEGVRKNAYVVINDHNSKAEISRVGVWLHRNRKGGADHWHVVWLPQDGSMCCLNPIYIGKDGIPHLSTYSVGDNIWAGQPSYRGYHPETNLQEGIAAYNWMYLGTEEAHGHPRTLVEGCEPMYDNRLLYAEGRHEKYLWNEDLEEVQKFRF